MTNTDIPFGYTNDGTPVVANGTQWRDRFGAARHGITPARVLQPGEVAVQAADLKLVLQTIGPRGKATRAHVGATARAALAAQSEPADQGEEPWHDDRCCMIGIAPGKGAHPDCPGVKALNTAPPADRTPDAATLPDTPWTTVRVKLGIRHAEVWHVEDDGIWRGNYGGHVKTDLARVQSYTILAEPPKETWSECERGQPDGETRFPDAANLDDVKAAEDRAVERAAAYTNQQVAASLLSAVERMRAELVAALLDEGDEWQGYDFLDRTYEVAQLVQGQALHDLADRIAQGGQQTEEEEGRG